MNLPSVSVIIPAIGRPSLEKILKVLVPQLTPGDEIQVIGDGPMPTSKKISESMGSPLVKYDEQGPFWKWGNPQRNIGIDRAVGQYLWFIDDDDDPFPNSITLIKAIVAQKMGHMHLFHVSYSGAPLPKMTDSRIYCGNVTGQCFVTPNTKGRLGKWTDNYEGDLSFITETISLFPRKDKDLVWHNEIICSVFPAGKRKIDRTSR